MAGNIIPAIATTNAVIAGLIVLQLFKILRGQIEKCQTVVLHKSISYSRNRLVSPCDLSEANPNCFVCSPNAAEVRVKLNVKSFTVKTLQEKVVVGKLNMVEPDAIIDDGKGSILISSDPVDMEGVSEKTLDLFGIQNGTRLQCDDYFQNFKLVLVIMHDPDLQNQEFEIIGDVSDVKPTEEVAAQGSSGNSHNTEPPDDDNDDITPIDYVSFSYKRKLSDDENGVNVPTKKAKKTVEVFNDADEIQVL